MALYGGHAISVANNTRVLYLGGIDANNNELNTIYEFKSETWIEFQGPKLPVNVTSRYGPSGVLSYFPMQTEYCSTEHALKIKPEL